MKKFQNSEYLSRITENDVLNLVMSEVLERVGSNRIESFRMKIQRDFPLRLWGKELIRVRLRKKWRKKTNNSILRSLFRRD